MTVVFVLASIGLAASWVAVQKHSRSSIFLLSVPVVFWAGSFLLFYVVSLRESASINQGLIAYWRGAFASVLGQISSRDDA